MAEMALMLMMALVRQLPRMLKNQQRAVWEKWPQPLLFGKHVVVVGIGSIAGELAPRCKALGMRVTGVSASARAVPHFDEVRSRTELPEALKSADFVVVLVPFDETSRGLFSAQMLGHLPPHAILVNLSRGGVVDEEALYRALSEGRLAGAGVDVFAIEPLPADSPLWHTPNLIVTPHVAGLSDIYAEQAAMPLLTNVRAMAEGRVEDLVNRVR
jgi:phosphoglycerate dehydrogenase-like enzyme